MHMPIKRNRLNVALVTSITQVLDAVRWDGTERTFDFLIDWLPKGPDISMSPVTGQLDVIMEDGRTKRVQEGNYVAITETGEVVFLTSERVLHHFTVIQHEPTP